MKKERYGAVFAGVLAGLANGLFGAGGGMLLLPVLEKTTKLEPKELFASSVCIILPLSLVSAAVYFLQGGSFAGQSLPYLIGGAGGGVVAGLLLKRLPTKLLHYVLGAFILWGGIRLLTA